MAKSRLLGFLMKKVLQRHPKPAQAGKELSADDGKLVFVDSTVANLIGSTVWFGVRQGVFYAPHRALEEVQRESMERNGGVSPPSQ